MKVQDEERKQKKKMKCEVEREIGKVSEENVGESGGRNVVQGEGESRIKKLGERKEREVTIVGGEKMEREKINDKLENGVKKMKSEHKMRKQGEGK